MDGVLAWVAKVSYLSGKRASMVDVGGVDGVLPFVAGKVTDVFLWMAC